MPTATATGADAAAAGAARNRSHNQGNQERKCTPEQKAAVLRIRACQATAFYEILDIGKTCTDVEIKKAYRKQSLLTHPDKNGYEHADEAFKMVSRAFGVLGDKEKRQKFDRFGTDPDSRSANAEQQNPFAGFANRGGAGGRPAGGGGEGMWEEQISPEEMFARFFGGGFGGGGFGGFDTGPQFVFNLGGGPGIRVHQFGGARPRARPQNPGQQEEPSLTSTLLGLLPIILLFILPILSSLFSEVSTPYLPTFSLETPDPPRYTSERISPNYKVKYYVNPHEIAKVSDSKLHQLDKAAEIDWVNLLTSRCQRERQVKRQLQMEGSGFFFQDNAKLELAKTMKMPSCEKLDQLSKPR